MTAQWKQKLFEKIQSEFPISSTPYLDLANEYGVSEDEIINAIREMKEQGIIRRLGATIDSRKAGYVSTLVACMVKPDKIDDVATDVGEYPQVTHSYERDNEFNLWFTFIADSESTLNRELDKISQLPGVEKLYSLSAKKMYKIKVQFK